MNSAPMTSRRLGPADFIHLAARPVRLIADRGTLWVTQDGELEDIEIDAGGQRDFDGHTRLTIGTLGGEAEVRLLPRPRAATALLGLPRWLGSLRTGGMKAPARAAPVSLGSRKRSFRTPHPSCGSQAAPPSPADPA